MNNEHTLDGFDLVCFSHLRWDFVYQRPQHLMSRFAKQMRVFFVEEAVFGADNDHVVEEDTADNVKRVMPRLHGAHETGDVDKRLQVLLSDYFASADIEHYIFWYYTPLALAFTDHFSPGVVIYDCMDEVSAFHFTPPYLKFFEIKLFAKADIVFTGGYSLYEAKRNLHPHVYCLPSSIDKEHFIKARRGTEDPLDQKSIAHPRVGYLGVIDERFDIELLENVASLRPFWNFIVAGPMVKIDPWTLPENDNIHYLGPKRYDELPAYIAGWDITMIPFVLNDSTRFISPTKTPEYLAAGKPVISTAIKDVDRPYGKKGLVHIIHTPEEFVRAAEEELEKDMATREEWLRQVDEFLSRQSWDRTWQVMMQIVSDALMANVESHGETLEGGIPV
jgi:glycosyltransferase involved in cell wall biosynthesis